MVLIILEVMVPGVQIQKSLQSDMAEDVGSLWDYIRQLFAIGLFVVIGVTSGLLATLLVALRLMPQDPRIGQSIVNRLLHLWVWLARTLRIVEVEAVGLESLQQLRGAIVAANHPSLVDAFPLLAATPRAVCVMRHHLQFHAALADLARLAGYIANDRGPTMVREGLSHLKRGDNLVIFPEGTRTVGTAPNPFKRGFALVATRSRAEVHTVLIRCEGELFKKGRSLLSRYPLPIRLTLTRGETFVADEDESADEFVARLERYFQHAILAGGEG